MMETQRGSSTGTGNKNQQADGLRQGMSGAASRAMNKVSEAGHAAFQEAGNQASELAGHAQGLASQAGEKLMHSAEQQKAAGADFVSGIAGAVRRAAGEFEGEVPQAAQYIRYAADQMDSVTDAFRRRDVGQMISDVQSFARRQPTAFIGVTFLAGFAAMRFLKSSSGNTPQQSQRNDAERFSGWSSPSGV